MEILTKTLEYNPILTLVFGFILALAAMWLFRAEIKEYIRKKYDLYTEEEVNRFINLAVKNYKEKTDENRYKGK